MKLHDLKQRLRKERPMTTVTLRMPQDVVDDLKRIAPRLGHQPDLPTTDRDTVSSTDAALFRMHHRDREFTGSLSLPTSPPQDHHLPRLQSLSHDL